MSVSPRNQRPNVRVSDRTCLLLAACTHGAAATGDRARARRISTPHHQRAPYPSRSAIHGGRCAIINLSGRARGGRAGRPAPSIHARPPYARTAACLSRRGIHIPSHLMPRRAFRWWLVGACSLLVRRPAGKMDVRACERDAALACHALQGVLPTAMIRDQTTSRRCIIT